MTIEVSAARQAEIRRLTLDFTRAPPGRPINIGGLYAFVCTDRALSPRYDAARFHTVRVDRRCAYGVGLYHVHRVDDPGAGDFEAFAGELFDRDAPA